MSNQFECVECCLPIENRPLGRIRRRCADCAKARARLQSKENQAQRKLPGFIPTQHTKTRDAQAVKEARRLATQALGCRTCGAELYGMQLQFCSQKCAARAHQIRQRRVFQPTACAECATIFTARDSKGKFCSTKCLHKARDRIYVTRRNQRVAAGEKFTKLDVLERDGWTCQACGIGTPSSLRGSTSPFAPEVDHIISVRDGGEHRMSNVRCLCRACNSKKGRRSGA